MLIGPVEYYWANHYPDFEVFETAFEGIFRNPLVLGEDYAQRLIYLGVQDFLGAISFVIDIDRLGEQVIGAPVCAKFFSDPFDWPWPVPEGKDPASRMHTLVRQLLDHFAP